MKKNSLTTAIIAGVAGVAGLAGVAHAVNLNPDGIGQVLLYPYYTVNGGNTTLVTVVNTADVAKVVKVRFLEAANSKEVLDFNLYLSAWDVWTGAVIEKTPGGQPYLITNDTSCTVPQITADGVAFRDYEFTYWRPDVLGVEATAAEKIARMRQGHLEIIESGDLYGNAATWATHKNGVPNNCAAIRARWASGGQWLAQAGGTVSNPGTGTGFTDVAPPGALSYDEDGELVNAEIGGPGGIFGSGVLVNGAGGIAVSYNAEAINGFYTGDEVLHYAPGTIYPSLKQAQTSDALPAAAVARVFDASGTPVDVAFPATEDSAGAVSAVLSARYIANEYAVVPGFVESEWVVTFPTKEVHTYRDILTGLAPFSHPQGTGSAGNPGNNEFDVGLWPEEFSFEYWDREEGKPTDPPGNTDFSPLPPPGAPVGYYLAAEANVIGFNQDLDETPATAILGAPAGFGGYGVTLADGFTAGWARIGFEQYVDTPAITHDGTTYSSYRLTGLPVIGFWVANYVNEDVTEGVLANYNLVHRHRVVRSITTPEGVITP